MPRSLPLAGDRGWASWGGQGRVCSFLAPGVCRRPQMMMEVLTVSGLTTVIAFDYASLFSTESRRLAKYIGLGGILNS